jgi:hypothetical protein
MMRETSRSSSLVSWNACDGLQMAADSSERYNYRTEDIVILTDDSSNPRQIPTRANMIQAITWLIQGAAPNDALFFH